MDSGLAFFDGPGESQVPSQVGNAISNAITMPISRRNVTTQSERNVEEIVSNFRNPVADLINANSVAKQELLNSRVAEICTPTLNPRKNYQELLADKIE